MSRFCDLTGSKFVHCFSYDAKEYIDIEAHEYRNENIYYWLDHFTGPEFSNIDLKSWIESWIDVYIWEMQLQDIKKEVNTINF